MRIICLLIHLGILQKFQETKKLNCLGKKCEVQSKWNLYLQLTGLTLIVRKQVPAAKWVKKLEGKKNCAIHLGFINMFLSLLQKKKKKIALSFSWQQKSLCETFNVEAHNVLIKK